METENKLTPELIAKAKQAKSPEELLALAKENGIEFTEENAKAYFEQLNKSGELSDDELDNVGGGCRNGGKLVVAPGFTSCYNWTCPHCGTDSAVCTSGWKHSPGCKTCKYCARERGLWVCNHPNNL